MPRKTANSNIPQPTAVEKIEPIEAVRSNEAEIVDGLNPFQLDEMLDIYAVPIAHEMIRRELPARVHHHIHRLVFSEAEADRAELLQLMQSAKLNIAFAVFHSVLQSVKEKRQLAAANDNDRPTVAE